MYIYIYIIYIITNEPDSWRSVKEMRYTPTLLSNSMGKIMTEHQTLEFPSGYLT